MREETAKGAGVPREMSVARWLFRPFVRIAGAPALVIGLGVIVVTGLAAGAGENHFPGLAGFRHGHTGSVWIPVLQSLVNWSVISVLLLLVSRLVAPRTVRFLDIAGTQALARAPLLLAALAALPAPVREANEALLAAAAEGGMLMPPAESLQVSVAAGVVVIAAWIWMIRLMWSAFAVSCNQRGARAVAIFAAAVVAGELATGFVLIPMLGDLAAAGT